MHVHLLWSLMYIYIGWAIPSGDRVYLLMLCSTVLGNLSMFSLNDSASSAGYEIAKRTVQAKVYRQKGERWRIRLAGWIRPRGQVGECNKTY
jgi:hypothetical protein